MANRTPLTAENPITLEMLNSFVQGAQVVPQTNINEIELWTKSAIESELATKADKSNFTKFIFNDSVTTLKDGYTYYGCTINHTVSSGTYYFYNCTGALTVSGNSAKIYATNSPGMVINGKTSSNWRNIFENGIAEYVAKNSSYTIYPSTSINTNLFACENIAAGDEIEIYCWCAIADWSSSLHVHKNLAESTDVIGTLVEFVSANNVDVDFKAISVLYKIENGYFKIREKMTCFQNHQTNNCIEIKKITYRRHL